MSRGSIQAPPIASHDTQAGETDRKARALRGDPNITEASQIATSPVCRAVHCGDRWDVSFRKGYWQLMYCFAVTRLHLGNIAGRKSLPLSHLAQVSPGAEGLSCACDDKDSDRRISAGSAYVASQLQELRAVGKPIQRIRMVEGERGDSIIVVASDKGRAASHGYAPIHRGARFSANARGPSIASALE